MDVSAIVVSPSGERFPSLFREYIANGALAALAQVEQSNEVLWQQDERDTLLHLLNFVLSAPATASIGVKILAALAPQMERTGGWDRWIPYLHKGAEQCERLQDSHANARLHLYLGMLYEYQNELAAARSHLSQAIDSFAQVGDRSNQAQAHNRLAYVARLERCYAEAEAEAARALRLLRPNDVHERSSSYFVKGVVAFDNKEWERAVRYFQRSVALIESLGDKRTLARRLRNLGPALRVLGRYEEALACYEHAIALFDSADLHDPVQQAVTRMNYGVVFWQLNQFERALEQYALAEPVLRTAQDQRNLALLYLNQGLAYREREQWTNAIRYLEASIALWHQLADWKWLASVHDDLGLLYVQQGNRLMARTQFQQALRYLEQIENDPSSLALEQDVMNHLRAIV